MCGAEKTGLPLVAEVELTESEVGSRNIWVELVCDATSRLVTGAERLGAWTEPDEGAGPVGMTDTVLAPEAVDETLSPPVLDAGPGCEAQPDARLVAAASAATLPAMRKVEVVALTYTKIPLPTAVRRHHHIRVLRKPQ